MSLDPDPIFQGCTRPPMLCGVPLVGLVLIVGSALSAGSLLMLCGVRPAVPLSLLAIVPLLIVVRLAAAEDDQIFRKLALFVELSWYCPNRRVWGGRCYSPLKGRNGKRG